MECLIVDNIDYHQIMNKIKEQRELLTEYIKQKIKNDKIYPGIPEDVWQK